MEGKTVFSNCLFISQQPKHRLFFTEKHHPRLDSCHNCGGKLVYRYDEWLVTKHWAKCPECKTDHYWEKGRWNAISEYDHALHMLDEEFPGIRKEELIEVTEEEIV